MVDYDKPDTQLNRLANSSMQYTSGPKMLGTSSVELPCQSKRKLRLKNSPREISQSKPDTQSKGLANNSTWYAIHIGSKDAWARSVEELPFQSKIFGLERALHENYRRLSTIHNQMGLQIVVCDTHRAQRCLGTFCRGAVMSAKNAGLKRAFHDKYRRLSPMHNQMGLQIVVCDTHRVQR